MSDRQLTDAEIAAALRVHLPERAAPGARARVLEAVAVTAQQRPAPAFVFGLLDADPIGRRRSLLFAAALVLALALAGATAAGALRLAPWDTAPKLNLEEPKELAAFARSAYDEMPGLPPLALTFLDDGSTQGRIYVARSGAVRIERYAAVGATEPDTIEILNGRARGALTVVGPDRVWEEQDEAIGEDPRVFVYAALGAARFAPIQNPGCEVAVTPGETYSYEPGDGWRYAGVEYVAGRPTHHVVCDGDLWIDVETRLVLRSRGPVFDDAGKAVFGAFHTIEVTDVTFGDQPADLFKIVRPAGIATISPEQECAREPLCSATPVPAFVPPAGSTPAPLPSPRPVPAANGWVAYVLQPAISGDGPADIYLAREGEEPRLIAGGDYKLGHNACPSFSPDGSMVAYAQGIEGGGYSWDQPTVVVIGVDTDGNRVEPETRISVPGPGGGGLPCPKWSPDGRSVAYTFLADTGYQALAITDVVDDTTRVLASDDAQGRIGGQFLANWADFAWSPAGDVIAATEGADGLWLVPVDGGDPTLLRAGQYRSPRWSPDGSRLAVTTCPSECERDSVHVLRVDGTVADVDLGPGETPAWSPSGDRLAYTTLGGADPVVVVNADGSDAHGVPSLSKTSEEDTWRLASGVIWSPDGSRLLYIGSSDVPENLYAVVSVPVSGDATHLVLGSPTFDLYAATASDLSWQPIAP